MVARVRRCRRIFRNIEPNGCHRGGGGLPLATTTRHPRHNLVIPAKAGISLPFPLPPRLGALPLRPRSRAILSPERAKDPDLFLTNLSLDVNISRSQGLTSFDCSLEKLTSRSKNKRWVREINAFVGEICFIVPASFRREIFYYLFSKCNYIIITPRGST